MRTKQNINRNKQIWFITWSHYYYYYLWLFRTHTSCEVQWTPSEKKKYERIKKSLHWSIDHLLAFDFNSIFESHCSYYSIRTTFGSLRAQRTELYRFKWFDWCNDQRLIFWYLNVWNFWYDIIENSIFIFINCIRRRHLRFRQKQNRPTEQNINNKHHLIKLNSIQN